MHLFSIPGRTSPAQFARPVASQDSALLIALTLANYTAVVRGTNRTTGVGRVEDYELPTS